MRYLLLILVYAFPACAQNLPEAPSHHFFDHGKTIPFVVLAGLVTADGITTQHVLHAYHRRELDPIARPLVTKGPATCGLSAIGYGFSMGTSYLFHKTGHHKLERLVLNTSVGIEAGCVAANLTRIARH